MTTRARKNILMFGDPSRRWSSVRQLPAQAVQEQADGQPGKDSSEPDVRVDRTTIET
jgi:hypothetical protein